MHRVNIMVEVSDEVYENVVVPYKKSRKFKDLIERLLYGYLDNEMIAAYVEGSLDAIQEERIESFNDAIAQMKGNLASVALMNDEAMAIAEQGRRAVQINNSDTTMAKGVPQVEEKNTEIQTANNTSDDELRKEVDGLRQQNEQVMKQMEMLMKVVQGLSDKTVNSTTEDTHPKTDKSVSSDDKESQVAATTVDEEFAEDDPLAEAVTFDDEEPIDLFDEAEDKDDDEEDEFLNNLLSGQVYSF